jgi:beta-fructofuranosidase
VVAFRDPFVQRYGTGWRMLLAGGLASGEGAVWVSTSADLRSWTPPVVAASGPDMGSLWECPALIDVDGRTVLVVSVGSAGRPHTVTYAFCDDRGDRLDLGPWQRLTYGSSPYAASAFTDAVGRPGLVAWLREVGDAGAGWMGAHSLPWQVRVADDHLVTEPPAILGQLRSPEVMNGLLPAVADLEWDARPGDFLAAENAFRMDAAGDLIRVTVDGVRHAMPWDEGPLRVVLDGPVLEVFGGRGVLAVPVPTNGRDGVLTGSTDRVRVHRLSGRPSAAR